MEVWPELCLQEKIYKIHSKMRTILKIRIKNCMSRSLLTDLVSRQNCAVFSIPTSVKDRSI